MERTAHDKTFPLGSGQVQQTIKDEITAISKWLEENGADCETERAHMKDGSRERAYWHYGYLVALRDILAMLQKQGR